MAVYDFASPSGFTQLFRSSIHCGSGTLDLALSIITYLCKVKVGCPIRTYADVNPGDDFFQEVILSFEGT